MSRPQLSKYYSALIAPGRANMPSISEASRDLVSVVMMESGRYPLVRY